jgi:4-methyl-5(b-hydroxyethyl)-thiazole monophosphate biosynthesis
MNKKVLLFLANGFEELEAAAFTDVMGWSREHGLQKVDLITTALHPEIKGTWNLIVKPELAFEEVNFEDYDALAIPGGFETAGFYEDAFDPRVQKLIQDFHAAGKIVASICVGALPIAKSGVLKGQKATTYDLPEGNRQAQLAQLGADVQKQNVVVDNRVITSTGPSTALDVAFKLLELLTSHENVLEVKKYMRF